MACIIHLLSLFLFHVKQKEPPTTDELGALKD